MDKEAFLHQLESTVTNNDKKAFIDMIFDLPVAGNNKQMIKSALINNATACSKLAEMGIDSKENLETAVRLYGDSRELFSKETSEGEQK